MNNPLANFLKNVLLDLPFSRKCEKEADYIGLLLMAKACYNPEEAVNLWQRMSDNSKANPELAAFLSTHPSHKKRIESIRSWLPEAKELFYKSECHDSLFASFNKNRFKYV
jgi:metalloendopeptidase OMA1, mitochondrial